MRRGERKEDGRKAAAPCPLREVGPVFAPFDQGTLLSSFARDRAAMHAYLYNGDDLWPKAVNLCTRGRNATLDLELGAGTSFDLALFGPAWEVHLHSVAATNRFGGAWQTLKGTRLLAAWPLVTSGLIDYLRAAHRLQTAARRALATRRPARAAARAKLEKLAKECSFHRFYTYWRKACRATAQGVACGPRESWPSGPLRGGLWNRRSLRLAADWGRRLKGALLHRLSFSARVLSTASAAEPMAKVWDRLRAPGAGGLRALEGWTARLAKAARARKLYFDDRRYDRFRRAHLTARIPGYAMGLSIFQLQAILHQAARQGRRPDAQLAAARKALARLRYLLRGGSPPSHLAAAKKERLKQVRKQYRALKKKLEADRKQMTRTAKRWFAEHGWPALRKRFRRVGDLALAGSFYYETEHLDETRSGFTHVAVLQQMGPLEGLGPEPWQFDRVLGFHYAYPVSRLNNSIPVEIVLPDPRVVARNRRYTWLAFQVPRRFRFANGKSSPTVSLLNIIYHAKRLLASCPGYRVNAGFFYGAVTWMVRHKKNAALLERLGAWQPKTHRTYGYLTLDPAALQKLKGKTIYLPVEKMVQSGPGRRRAPVGARQTTRAGRGPADDARRSGPGRRRAPVGARSRTTQVRCASSSLASRLAGASAPL
jgi:hypothetical protein